MKILNIGSLEFLAILILALIVLGPGRIVDTARSLGFWLQKFTKTRQWNDIVSTAQEVREFPHKIMREAGLDDSINEIKNLHIDVPTEETQAIIKSDEENKI